MITVLAHGVFDCFHYGHLHHLRQARGLGDRLVVSITPDKHVTRSLVCTDEQRKAVLESCRLVAEVVMFDDPTSITSLREIKPDFYVKGDEYKGKDLPELPVLEELGIKMVFTETAPIHSSNFKNETCVCCE